MIVKQPLKSVNKDDELLPIVTKYTNTEITESMPGLFSNHVQKKPNTFQCVTYNKQHLPFRATQLKYFVPILFKCNYENKKQYSHNIQYTYTANLNYTYFNIQIWDKRNQRQICQTAKKGGPTHFETGQLRLTQNYNNNKLLRQILTSKFHGLIKYLQYI